MYAYTTPVIIIIGLFGNVLSLGVFLSKNLRNMSASRYLAVLAAADTSTLVFYVLGEWLKRGVKMISPGNEVTFLDVQGTCQIWLYFSYFSRFLSSWLIVCFTCERFVGVCLSLRRRNLGSLKETSRIIVALIAISCFVVIYKPIMSSVRTIRNQVTCTRKEEFEYPSFILDFVYGFLTTLVPFVIISTLNVLIIRRILRRNYLQRKRLVTEESHIRLEFTFILLVISFFYILLSLPYLTVWVRNFLQDNFFGNNLQKFDSGSFDYWTGVLSITRTIYYLNFCINFFLYTVTGAYFRKELKALFFKSYSQYEQCNKIDIRTQQTVLYHRSCV